MGHLLLTGAWLLQIEIKKEYIKMDGPSLAYWCLASSARDKKEYIKTGGPSLAYWCLASSARDKKRIHKDGWAISCLLVPGFFS